MEKENKKNGNRNKPNSQISLKNRNTQQYQKCIQFEEKRLENMFT